MKSQVFGAGTIPGSPTTANEVKTLLCLLLAELGKPLTFEQLHEILLEGRMVNYFDLVQNLDQLVESGHIRRFTQDDTTEAFEIQELGIKTARELYTSLPKSVRDRTLNAGRIVLARQKRLQEVDAEMTETEDGYQVRLAIPDHGSDLLSLQLFLPTRGEAEAVTRRFLNDPIFLYKAILALLQGDKSVLGDLTPTDTPLF